MGMLSKMKSVNKGEAIANIYGHVSGCEVGTTFRRRRDFNYIHTSKDAIACGPEGPFSILMLNNKNIQDNGHIITVSTGEVQLYYDGMDPTPQGPFNQTLMTGLRSQLPIRVIRSSFVGSVFAPKTGFRYDGLYKLRDYTTTNIGDSHISFKFLLARIQCQLAVPWEDETSVNPTRYSQATESLEIIKEPQILHTAEGDIDSCVAIEGYRLDESKYGQIDSSTIKLEDAEMLNVSVKKEPAITVMDEEVEVVKTESETMSDDPQNDDDLSAARKCHDKVIILDPVNDASPEFEIQTAEINCIAIAKNEVEIDENLFVKTEINPKSPIKKSTGDEGNVSVLCNGPILDEEVDPCLPMKFKEIKFFDETKPLESSELAHSEHSSPEPILNHYTSSNILQRNNCVNVNSTSEISVTTPECQQAANVFYVIAALDKLYGPKQIIVSGKYIELLSSTLNGTSEARVSSLLPLRPTAQRAIQDHRGDNIISGISTLDFDGDEFVVDNVQDSMVLDETETALQLSLHRNWWLVETEDNCMMLEPKPSLMMTHPSFSSPDTVKEANTSLLKQQPISPVMLENNRSPTSQRHISPSQAVQHHILPSSTVGRKTKSLSSEQPHSPPQMVVEVCSPSTPQRTHSPISVDNNISQTSQQPLTPLQSRRKTRRLSSQRPLSPPPRSIRKARSISSKRPHSPPQMEVEACGPSTSQQPLSPPRPIRKTRSLSSKRPHSPQMVVEACGSSTSHRPHSPIIVETYSSPTLQQDLSPPQAIRKSRRLSAKQPHSSGPSTVQQLSMSAVVEASSFNTPERDAPLQSTPVFSIYRNLRSSTKKLLIKECSKCLPPANLLEGILGKNLDLFRTFYSQNFCQCNCVKQSNLYDKMHHYILKLNKKNPKYLTAIVAYLLYGQFKNKNRDVPSTFNSCQNFLNGKESGNDDGDKESENNDSDKESGNNDSKVQKCKRKYTRSVNTSTKIDSQSDVTSTSASPISSVAFTRTPSRRGKKRKCDDNLHHQTNSLFDLFNTDSDQPNNAIDLSLSDSVAPNLLFKPTPDMIAEYDESPQFDGFYPAEILANEHFINIWLDSISSIFMANFQGFDIPSKDSSIIKSKTYDQWFDSNFHQCT